jgi:GntR family transcriptional regulator / MocR family aminotransferase
VGPGLLRLGQHSGEPLHRQVYDELRAAILACRIPPGSRLPSTRALAADLGIARNTVAVAYDQLRIEGYTYGRRGGGTWVRSELPDRLLRPPRRVRPAGGRNEESDPVASARPALRLSRRGRAMAEAASPYLGGLTEPPVAFHLGTPTLDIFPQRVWSRLSAQRWRGEAGLKATLDPAGDPWLREVIAAYVTGARGARCSPGQVLIVSGTQQALDLVTRVLLDEGDEVWLEEPGYFGARSTFQGGGARIVPVPVDDDGLNVAEGEGRSPHARLAYVTPSHQFPLGAVMGVARRLALLRWATRTGAWIVEDDYDSEFRYSGRPLPCLQGMDASGNGPAGDHVIYIGTFSKTLAPGLRLGYMIVPDGVVDAFRAVRSAIDRHPPTHMQSVLAEFVAEGHYTRHLRRVRTLYAERQASLLREAGEHLGHLLVLRPDPAGLHLAGELADGLDEAAATRAASAAGVIVSPLSRHCVEPPALPPHLLLGYAGFDASAIATGVRRLRHALEAASIRRD